MPYRIPRSPQLALTVGLIWTLVFHGCLVWAAGPRTQERQAKVRVEVPIEAVRADDGDTFSIEWGPEDREIVRILGIDTPETMHPEHNIPYDQPFGREAAAFAKGAFAVASKIELLRADTKDPYGRTLGYVFLNGRNYSVMIVEAGLAAESVSRYGDNGFPDEASKVIVAARQSGPLPFENPHDYRQRMRAVSESQSRKKVKDTPAPESANPSARKPKGQAEGENRN